MSKAKKILNVVTAAVLVLLIGCTVASKFVSEALQPVVETVKPDYIELEVNGVSELYDMVVPSEAVFSIDSSSYVYVARQRKGVFGPEYYTVLAEVQVLASDSQCTAIGGRNIIRIDDIITKSSRELDPGVIVKLNTDSAE